MPVEVVHWNPPVRRVGRLLNRGKRVNNFGDLLGPIVVNRILAESGLSEPREHRRVLAVGSILKLARDGDVIWGIGANGKSLSPPFPFSDLDVRAVRGPLTRDLLIKLGIPTPAIYGDPGLLVGHFWNRQTLAQGHQESDLIVVPNLHDFDHQKLEGNVVNPRDEIFSVLGRIAASSMVVGSSLHAIVVADALGIPARLIKSSSEPDFKYLDYYRGSGRTEFKAASTVHEAVALGGEPLLDWDPQPLLDAFPRSLWER